MNLDDIKQILELVREHDLSEFELERDGLKVRIRKAGREVTYVAPTSSLTPPMGLPMPAAATAPPAAAGAGPAEEVESVNLAVIK